MPINELAGKPLRYLIGRNEDVPLIGADGEITEGTYDDGPPSKGIGVGYCNVFDQTKTGLFGPYLDDTDVSAQYNERRVNPEGAGWDKLIDEQLGRRKRAALPFVEWDNIDGYPEYGVDLILKLYDRTQAAGLGILAKNPRNLIGALSIVKHAAVGGVINEAGAGAPDEMEDLRKRALKPDLPIYWVFYGRQRATAEAYAKTIASRGYANMSVTYSDKGEYGSSVDIPAATKPKLPSAFAPGAILPVQQINVPAQSPTMVDQVPPWLAHTRADLGLEEFAGPANNPKIIAKTMAIADRFPNVPGFREYCAEYKDDTDQAWCGLEAGDAVSSDGHMPPFGAIDEERFLWAASWRTWGIPLSAPRVGAILVFNRHVAFLNRIIDANTYEVIGGNQSSRQGGAVTLTRRKASDVIAMRWPAGAAVGVDPGPPPADGSRPLLRYGWVGPEVAELQTLLGMREIDGEFGRDTLVAVRSFQSLHALEVDGEVGPDTWGALLAGKSAGGNVTTTSTTLSAETIAKIAALAASSEIARYSWEGRGRAPIGYIKGMAVVFAKVYLDLKAGGSAARVMAQANTGNETKDALAWCDAEFRAMGISNATSGVATLRHLFMLLYGLGIRESSGQYNEGVDVNAGAGRPPDEIEAGLFQQSWNSHDASPEIPKLLAAYSGNAAGFVEIFREGVAPGSSTTFGSGDAAAFQNLCKSKPAFAVECAAVGLRVIRQHWGPINRHEVEDVRPELAQQADALLQQVQAIVDAVPLVQPIIIPKPPEPPMPPDTTNPPSPGGFDPASLQKMIAEVGEMAKRVGEASARVADIAGKFAAMNIAVPTGLPSTGTATVGAAVGTIASAVGKFLPMLGVQGSVWGTAILWGLQALNLVGTAAGDTATPTGGVATAGLAASGISGVIAMIGRWMNKPKS